jgi:hypothetical protein
MIMAGATVLENAISPAEAVETLGRKGLKISERSLREKARLIGAYRQIGKTIFFLPSDLEKIMEPQLCSPSSNAQKARSGSRAARSTVSDLSEARAKLQSLKRGKNSPR